LPSLHRELVLRVFQDFRQSAAKTGDGDRQHNAVLGEQSSNLVAQSGSLRAQARSDPMQRQQILLLRFTRQRTTTALVQALCVDADGLLSLQEFPGRRSVTCE